MVYFDKHPVAQQTFKYMRAVIGALPSYAPPPHASLIPAAHGNT